MIATRPHRKRDSLVVRIELPRAAIARLVDRGYLPPDATTDGEAIAAAVLAFVQGDGLPRHLSIAEILSEALERDAPEAPSLACLLTLGLKQRDRLTAAVAGDDDPRLGHA